MAHVPVPICYSANQWCYLTVHCNKQCNGLTSLSLHVIDSVLTQNLYPVLTGFAVDLRMTGYNFTNSCLMASAVVHGPSFSVAV